MTASGIGEKLKAGGSRIGTLLSAVALSLLFAAPARAQAIDCVGDAGGIIDGFVNYPIPPANINIDGPCTIRNYTASNPLTSNISWFGSLPSSTLLIFDNVVHTGNMACNLAVQGNRIWFVNSASTTVQDNCLALLIPVEKIDKANPPGPPFVTIGVPFTWSMRIPILFDPSSGIVIEDQGSLNDLHSITVVDDLNATGVNLTYVSHTVTWVDDGTAVPHNFTNVNNVLTWSNFPIVTAGRQFVIALTVVLDNNDPPNADGTSFINTATWNFGRLIDNIFHIPLPGENGISPPLTISAPELIADKTGPATLNLGQAGDFTIDIRNDGSVPAWDVTVSDEFPDGPTGGMCDLQPQILSAQVFEIDGITPVSGPLVAGVDYTLTWSGAPACQLDLSMLTAAAAIGPDERLIIRYRTELDANTQDGVALTNVAGAIQWFNGPSSAPQRVVTNESLSNGTPGFPDHEDDHTVIVDLQGVFFSKTAANVTTGVDPTTTASPGDTLRYTLRFRTTDAGFNNFRIFDELDALNSPPAFVPGTLTLVTVPPGANTTFTSSTGGANGTGVVDIRNLSLPANSEAVIEFEVVLQGTLVDGTVVADQSVSRLPNNTVIALSDDPNVNGIADPNVAGDEDPTRVTIVAGPSFVVRKISTDLTGDPNILLAGETLRYTITVQNLGPGDAVDVVLRDAVPPANTTYVAGSTRLNGTLVPDVGGLSALVAGILIHPPSDPIPGSMPADPSGSPANTATITFDVLVSPNVADGTIISNQGFVSAVADGVIDQPSDDPDTPVPNDPTRDVVGNLPLLFAAKQAVLAVDQNGDGIINPLDVLRYTIVVQNSGTTPATGVVLTDALPANTTYVANTTFLNGAPYGQPDGGVPPLASGIAIGTILPGDAAVVVFDLQVVAGTPNGTLISNQAVVDSVELPDLPTDGDGNPSTGPEPTVVVVGDSQQLAITKQVTVVGGGAANPGATLEYVVTVTNIGTVPAFNVVLTDDLSVPVPGQLLYVPGSATMNGATAGVTFAGTTITADYFAVNGPLAPGGTVILRFQATLAPSLAPGTIVINIGGVSWDTPTQTETASVSIVVGGVPGFAALNGSAWHDRDFDDIRDTGVPPELPLAGWTVQLFSGTTLLATVLTDAAGDYRIVGVQPNDVGGVPYVLRFSAPNAVGTTALLGRAASSFTNFLQRIEGIVVSSGANLLGLNLPIDPNGVVYNSMARVPVAGAILSLLDAGTATALPSTCFEDQAQQGQVTLASGYYKFDILFDPVNCPAGGNYLISVTAPGTFVPGTSQIIPPASDATTGAFSVPLCPATPADVIPGTVEFCEVQGSELAPVPAIPPVGPGTVHYLHLTLDDGVVPGDSQIFNNHIPLDPVLAGALAITKATPAMNVIRGQLVPYTITVRNVSGMLITDAVIVDRFPAGFTYVPGSALVDDVPDEPAILGQELTWDDIDIAGTQVVVVKLLLAVGAGVGEGEYVNRAQVLNGLTGLAITGEAIATVRLMPDPTFDCTDVTGKVFNDANRNGIQEDGEDGLAGVRLVTVRGLHAVTDAYGRYHIACAIVPHESRGSNFVLKLDDRTLPSGFRMSTDPLRVQRATRGKVLRINFGASIYRVVAIDLSDAAFEPGTTDLRVQWRPRLDLLLEELRKAPAVLRLSYVADTEDAALVERRVEAIQVQVTEAWDAAVYELTIEPEIFWRRGAPPAPSRVRAPESR